MTSTIDTLGKAARHNMIVQVRCPTCGRSEEFNAVDLVMRWGGGRDPQSLKFYCKRCRPHMTIKLLEKSSYTLADLIARRGNLRVCCQKTGCWNTLELDLEKLAERLGRDHGALHKDLVGYFRCTKCNGRRGRDIGFNFTPNYDMNRGR